MLKGKNKTQSKETKQSAESDSEMTQIWGLMDRKI